VNGDKKEIEGGTKGKGRGTKPSTGKNGMHWHKMGAKSYGGRQWREGQRKSGLATGHKQRVGKKGRTNNRRSERGG